MGTVVTTRASSTQVESLSRSNFFRDQATVRRARGKFERPRHGTLGGRVRRARTERLYLSGICSRGFNHRPNETQECGRDRGFFKQSGFTLRLENRGKPTSQGAFGESGITDKALAKIEAVVVDFGFIWGMSV